MDALNEIITKYKIGGNFDNAKKMDKENRIFISDDSVIKIYYPKKFKYYFNELDVYKSLGEKDYLPKLYLNGEEDGYKFVMISRLNGQTLFDSWNESSVSQRISYVEQISNILRDINNVHSCKTNFLEVLNEKFYAAYDELNYDVSFKNWLFDLYVYYTSFISNIEKTNLIHIDVHFYNFFVFEGKIYAYDFENMIMAPIEYQLLRWYRMWKYPETFVFPKNSLTNEQIQSYDFIMGGLLNNYKKLSSSENFDERLKAYLLVYLLEEAKRCRLSEEIVKQYIYDNINVRVR